MTQTIGGLTFSHELSDSQKTVFTDEAMGFVAGMVNEFQDELNELLAHRVSRQAEFDSGKLPDFLPETKAIREGDWKIKGIPTDLLDRRIEITGPTDRKMVINALNANVKVFMADFEDSLSPTWANIADGQVNLRDAVNGTISYDNPGNGKHYELKENPAVLICRTRGLHLPEKNVLNGDKRIPGCLLDFGVYLFTNYEQLLKNGSGPYFYLPKLQSHLESRWWNKVLTFAENKLGLEVGTIKATFLIETLPAVFEMEEILYEMRDHVVALNCGRWDYIFSYIKILRKHSDRILPDRHSVTMEKPFLNAYSRLLIKTCHKRGAMAMGGMAAFIPAKTAEENEKVLAKVTHDKTTEASNGHDGTWIAHPGLAETAIGVFNQYIPEGKPNMMHITREEDAPITAAELVEPSKGECTEDGMRLNIRIAVQYIEAWISGNGCVPIYGLMEDAATAEISRASIWQWIKNGISLSNGKLVTEDLFTQLLAEEVEGLKDEVGEERFTSGKFYRAADMFREQTISDELVEFLTLPGYEEL